MMTVKYLLEHSDPQQRFVIYPPRNTGIEDSGKAKDLLKECLYLDNEVTEFYLSAMEKNTIGVKCRSPICIDICNHVRPAILANIVLQMIDKMRAYKNGHREMHGNFYTDNNEEYGITISLTKKHNH